MKLPKLSHLFRKRVPKQQFSELASPQIQETIHYTPPTELPAAVGHPVRKGRVTTKGKPREWQLGTSPKGGGVIRTMPRELKKIKQAQERLPRDSM